MPPRRGARCPSRPRSGRRRAPPARRSGTTPASGSASRGRGRLREGVAAEADAGRIDAAGDDVVPLPRRRDDHESGARRDAAGERRVERPLEPHLPQARPEHAHRLEDVGDPPRPAPAGDDRRERVAEPDHVRHRRARQLPQREREGGRHAHPAVAERRCEVGHPGAVEQLDPRSPVRASADSVSVVVSTSTLVAALDEARDEPTCDLDRAAERVRGPVGRDREEDPKPPVHAGDPTRWRSSSVGRPDAGAAKRILVLNQYYWPGIEATAQLLSQLCEALAEDFDVTVVTGALHGHELPRPRRFGTACGSCASARRRTTGHSSICARANYASYLGDTVLHALRGRAAGPRSLHDRPADRRRRRARRRAPLRGAAPRHQPGRLPRDRRAS